MAKIQLTIPALEEILRDAKEAKKRDGSLSSAVEFEVIRKTEFVGSSDVVDVRIESAYAECFPKRLGVYPKKEGN